MADLESLQRLLKPGFSGQEALEILRGDRDEELFPDEFYIQPPDPALLTDEESGDEDEPGSIDHLPGRQLLAPAEIVIGNSRLGEDYDDIISRNVSPLDTPGPSVTPVTAPHIGVTVQTTDTSLWIRKRLRRKLLPKWTIGDLTEVNFPTQDYFSPKTQEAELTCAEALEKFLDADIIEHLRDQTEKYTLFKNMENQYISNEELKCFIGILILSGYNQVPSVWHYWDGLTDMNNELVSSAMRRNRFLIIKQFIHCNDNNTFSSSTRDKMWKLRPFMDSIKNNCIKNYVPEQNLCYDESMIKYFGRHPCKQFIRGKPLRFGYKAWCLNTKEGYLINFDVYQGKNEAIRGDYYSAFGKAAAPVIKFIEELPKDKRELPYNFYFDSLFSGINLFRFLKDRGYSATGTIRENRIPKKSILENRNKFKKRQRGSCNFALERRDGILFIRWLENGVVTVASTVFGVSPMAHVKRYSKKQRKNITISRPLAISKYNSFMGGTDQMDRFIENYRIAARGMKWWWPIFTWLIDVCVVNAWLLYRKKDKIGQLEFRRSIVQTYLTRYATVRRHPGPSQSLTVPSKLVADDIRYDRVDHFVGNTIEKKKKRCARKNCTSIIRTMCVKCKVGLCIGCFASFHTR